MQLKTQQQQDSPEVNPEVNPEVVIKLAQSIHQDWVEQSVKNGVNEKYKPVPKVDLSNGGQDLLEKYPQSRIAENGFEQNIVQNAENIHPELMQKLNGNLAKGYVAALNNFKGKPEDAAAAVHDVWMRENEWQRNSAPHLFEPYAALSEEEKEKDRRIVNLTMEALKVNKNKEAKEEIIETISGKSNASINNSQGKDLSR